MKYSVEKKEKYAIVISEVEKLDAVHAADIKSELVFLIKSGHKNIVVDLEKTRYIDSSGLSALLTGNRLSHDQNGSFVLCCLQPAVEKLVSISQLTSVFEIAPTRNEAIDIVLFEEVGRDLGDEGGE